MKTLVLYYSKSGNNAYLAGKIARSLNADIEAIRPRFGAFAVLALFSALKKSFGIRKLTHDVSSYENIVLCGPIWMGMLISPLRDVINQYRNDIKKAYVATCCGGGDAMKDDRFGYAPVFAQVLELLGEKCVLCEAFPIDLLQPPGSPKDDAALMKIRLSDANFTGAIQERFNRFLSNINSK